MEQALPCSGHGNHRDGRTRPLGYVRQQDTWWPRTNWRLVGRWIGHMRDGQFRHVSIGSSRPIAHEAVLGWAFHYVVGCIYAALYLTYASIVNTGAADAGVRGDIRLGHASIAVASHAARARPWDLRNESATAGLGAHSESGHPYHFWLCALLFLSNAQCIGIVVTVP